MWQKWSDVEDMYFHLDKNVQLNGKSQQIDVGSGAKNSLYSEDDFIRLD